MENKYSDLYVDWVSFIKEKKVFGCWLRDVSIINESKWYDYFDFSGTDNEFFVRKPIKPLIPNFKKTQEGFELLMYTNSEDLFRKVIARFKEYDYIRHIAPTNYQMSGVIWGKVLSMFFQSRRLKDKENFISNRYARKLRRINNGTKSDKKPNKTLDDNMKWYDKLSKQNKKNQLFKYYIR